jgi:hypothetical protein
VADELTQEQVTAADHLFTPPTPRVVHEPLEPETPLESATAEDVKAALRKRHPGQHAGGMVGQWTCIEEWLAIDLLALNAWSKADVIGYEIKISRSDLRRELLRPHKRTGALAVTTEFYLAIPAGLLTDEEIAYEEPEWEDDDFRRTLCPGVPEFGPEPANSYRSKPYGGRCSRWTREGRKRTVPVPVPEVIVPPDWVKPHAGESDEAFHERAVKEHYYYRDRHRAVCWACDGRGYLERSRVERDAPTCWVPRDVGLVTVSARGCRVVKRSPKRKDPEPIASTRKHLNDLVRWVSHRPDPRHRMRAAA